MLSNLLSEVKMNKIKKILKQLWQDESGQGATEYILILVVAAVIVMAFKGKIMSYIEGASEDAGKRIKGAVGTIGG